MAESFVAGMLMGMSGLGGEQGGLFQMVVMMAIIFGIFYFLVIRPQRQQQSEHEEMIAGLEAGDEVVTVGGLHGRLTSVNEDTVELQAARDTTLTLSRDKISRVKGDGE